MIRLPTKLCFRFCLSTGSNGKDKQVFVFVSFQTLQRRDGKFVRKLWERSHPIVIVLLVFFPPACFSKFDIYRSVVVERIVRE